MDPTHQLSLGALIRASREKRGKIPYEIGAFVLLEACEQILGRPTPLTLENVYVRADGTVVVEAGKNVTVDASTRSVCETLATVLVGAGPGVPPVMVDLVENGPSTGDWQLARLRDELEAALLPLNRAAAKRVLSRMIREALGEFERRRPREEQPPEGELDSELDGLLGDLGLSVPSPPPAKRPKSGGQSSPGLAQGSAGDGNLRSVANSDDSSEKRFIPVESPVAPAVSSRSHAPAGAAPISNGAAASGKGHASARNAVEGTRRRSGSVRPEPRAKALGPSGAPSVLAEPEALPSGKQRTISQELEAFEAQAGRRKGTGPIWAAVFLLMTVATAVAFVMLRPDLIQRAMGEEEPPELEPSPELASAEPQRQGKLLVDVNVDGAEVYLFVERGPAVAEGLPGGVAHEFLALEDGLQPTRALVPAHARWESRDGAYWHELAIQLPEEAPPDRRGRRPGLGTSLFLKASRGEASEASPGAPETPPPARGNIRVVTNPAGAKVYALVGFSPGVEVKNLYVDEPTELLVWKEGHRLSRVAVLPSDWKHESGDDAPRATVTVALEEN